MGMINNIYFVSIPTLKARSPPFPPSLCLTRREYQVLPNSAMLPVLPTFKNTFKSHKKIKKL